MVQQEEPMVNKIPNSYIVAPYGESTANNSLCDTLQIKYIESNDSSLYVKIKNEGND